MIRIQLFHHNWQNRHIVVLDPFQEDKIDIFDKKRVWTHLRLQIRHSYRRYEPDKKQIDVYYHVL